MLRRARGAMRERSTASTMRHPGVRWVMALALVVAPACDRLPFDLGGGAFTVQVVEPGGAPIAGATIAAEPTSQAYPRPITARTDAEGKAQLPGEARGRRGGIRALNHVPVAIQSLGPGTHTLQPTPGRIEPAGQFDGQVVEASATEISALTLLGYLRRFTAAGGTFQQSYEVRIDSPYVRGVRLERDTLWVNDTGGALVAFSLADRDHPRELFRLPIDSPTDWVTLDSVRVGGWNPTVTFRHTKTGQLETLATVEGVSLASAQRLDGTHAAIVSGRVIPNPLPLAVVDVSDPRRPTLPYSHGFPGAVSILFSGDTALIGPGVFPGYSFSYQRVVLGDPAHPLDPGPLTSPVALGGFLPDGVAVGTLCLFPGDDCEAAFLRRVGNAYQILATSGEALGGVLQVVSAPPYAVVRQTSRTAVWRLSWQSGSAGSAVR